MTKAEQVISKFAEKSTATELGMRSLGSSFVPIAGPYLFTKEEGKKKHPVVSAMLGPIAAEGALAKDTGKSNLGAAAKAIAVPMSVIGAGAGGAAGAILSSGNAKTKAVKALASAIGGGIYGGVVGGASGSMSYGMGHLFGKKYKKEAELDKEASKLETAKAFFNAAKEDIKGIKDITMGKNIEDATAAYKKSRGKNRIANQGKVADEKLLTAKMRAGVGAAIGVPTTFLAGKAVGSNN